MTFVGVGFCWLSTTSVTSGLTGLFSLQSRKYNRKADIFEGRDSNGNVIGKNAYNNYETATLTYLVTGVSLNGSASVAMPNTFDQVVVADSAFTQIAGTWRVSSDAEAGNTNKDALMVTVPLERYPNYS